MICMRTTLDLPGDLLEEAMTSLNFKSKTDTVVYALRELMRRQKLDELKGLAGRVLLEINIAAAWRRPR